MKQITIYLDEELLEWLENLSAKEQRTISQQVRFMLKKYKEE